MDHAFGTREPFSVGVEEELLLVDPQSGQLVTDASRVLEAIELPQGAAAHEAYAAEIELRSPPTRSAPDAVASLARGRAAAREAGATLLAAGLHPTAQLGDAKLVDEERYRKVSASMRGLIQRTPECALHVHIGMADPDTALAAFNGLRGWLPLLAGLAASSPFWFGTDSGLASARAALVGAYPGRGIPRPLRDMDEYEETLAAAASGGGPDDYTLLWWDVRLHPRFGTVEVREMDVQSRLADVTALAALVQGLARHEAEAMTEPAASEAIEWSMFRAARDGLRAEILHEGRLVPLAEAARAAVALARGHAREVGAEEELEGIDRLLREGGGANRQRDAHRRDGMRGLLELLLEETAGRY